VAREPFEGCEADHVGTELPELRRLETHEVRALQEIFDAQRREEAGRSARGQHVVRAGQVIAEGHGCIVPDEDRARIGDALERGVGLVEGK